MSFTPRAGLARRDCINAYIRDQVPWAEYKLHCLHFFGPNKVHEDLVKAKAFGQTLEERYNTMLSARGHISFVHQGCRTCEGMLPQAARTPVIRAFLVPVSGDATELDIPLAEDRAEMALTIKRAIEHPLLNGPVHEHNLDYVWCEQPGGACEWMVVHADLAPGVAPVNENARLIPGIKRTIYGPFALLYGTPISGGRGPLEALSIPRAHQPSDWKRIMLGCGDWPELPNAFQLIEKAMRERAASGRSGDVVVDHGGRGRRNPWHDVMMIDFQRVLSMFGFPVEMRGA